MDEKIVKDSQGLVKDLVNDCISRQAAIDALGERPMVWAGSDYELGARNQYDADVLAIETVPSAQPKTHDKRTEKHACDCISRQAAIDALYSVDEYNARSVKAIKELPPVQPKKEIAKRVLWTGWKGYRDTRYKCPNCKKPVKNDDIYCHRCGQKLMFPHISFTDYVPGEKQETIVRWDDE